MNRSKFPVLTLFMIMFKIYFRKETGNFFYLFDT